MQYRMLAVDASGTMCILRQTSIGLVPLLERKSETELFAGAWSADGSHVATAGRDGVIDVLRPKGDVLSKLLAEVPVLSLCWAPDNCHLAAATGAGVQVWNLRTGQKVVQYEGHTGAVCAIKYSPDGRYIASGGSDRLLHIWEAGSGLVLKKNTTEEPASIYAIDWSPQGMLAVASEGVVLYSAQDLSVAFRSEQKAWTYAVAFSPDARHLALSCFDTRAYVLRHKEGTWETCLTYGHQSWGRALGWSPDGKLLASGERNGMLHVWDMHGATVNSYQRQGIVYAVAWSPLQQQESAEQSMPLAQPTGKGNADDVESAQLQVPLTTLTIPFAAVPSTQAARSAVYAPPLFLPPSQLPLHVSPPRNAVTSPKARPVKHSFLPYVPSPFVLPQYNVPYTPPRTSAPRVLLFIIGGIVLSPVLGVVVLFLIAFFAAFLRMLGL